MQMDGWHDWQTVFSVTGNTSVWFSGEGIRSPCYDLSELAENALETRGASVAAGRFKYPSPVSDASVISVGETGWPNLLLRTQHWHRLNNPAKFPADEGTVMLVSHLRFDM